MICVQLPFGAWQLSVWCRLQTFRAHSKFSGVVGFGNFTPAVGNQKLPTGYFSAGISVFNCCFRRDISLQLLPRPYLLISDLVP